MYDMHGALLIMCMQHFCNSVLGGCVFFTPRSWTSSGTFQDCVVNMSVSDVSLCVLVLLCFIHDEELQVCVHIFILFF